MAGLRRFVLAAPVRATAAPADATARPPAPADAEALAQLLLDAYRGSIDDEGETLDDSRAVVAKLFAGEFGPMLWSLSEVIERDGRLVAAALLTVWFDGPFVAFMVTLPTWQRRGLARAGLQRAFNRLAAGAEPWLRLVVTQGNTPAEALYESLGFLPVAAPPLSAA
ncbi:MAG: GNAT family N-acetyltransferase [Rubrivivax sp.]|nr:GNAT family N-acetyltransferase [Rubrivivax sp.]